MALGVEVGLAPGDFVFDGDPATTKTEGTPTTIQFVARLLWPNGWMDEDATWYGSRPRYTLTCQISSRSVYCMAVLRRTPPPKFCRVFGLRHFVVLVRPSGRGTVHSRPPKIFLQFQGLWTLLNKIREGVHFA